jgi:phage-related protein
VEAGEVGDQQWRVDFYEDENGVKPVLVYLSDLPDGLKKRFATNVEKLEAGGTWIGRPVVAFIETDLWELRFPKSPGNPRVLFCATIGQRLVLLHGFNKNGPNDKVPESEKVIARVRMKHEIERLELAQENETSSKQPSKKQEKREKEKKKQEKRRNK